MQCRLILAFKGLGTVVVPVVMNTSFSRTTHTHTHTHNHCEVRDFMSRFEYEYCRVVGCDAVLSGRPRRVPMRPS
jgi:hypothetical protein